MYQVMVQDCISPMVALRDEVLWVPPFEVQSTPVISRLLGAKIRERKLSGSPIISRFSAKATTRESRDLRPTLGRLQPSNSVLSDNRFTYVSQISTHIDIATATNHNNQHYILIFIKNVVAVAAYVRLTTRSQAKFQNNEIESHSIFRAQPHLHRVPPVVHFNSRFASVRM